MVQFCEALVQFIKELLLKNDKELVQKYVERRRVLGALVLLHQCLEILVNLCCYGLVRGMSVGHRYILLGQFSRGHRQGSIHEFHEFSIICVQQPHEHDVTVQIVILTVDKWFQLYQGVDH